METLRATEPVRVDQFVLIPVQRIRLESWFVCGGACVQAWVEPQAIVVGKAGSWRALGLDGAEVGLEALLEEAEGLAGTIERERTC